MIQLRVLLLCAVACETQASAVQSVAGGTGSTAFTASKQRAAAAHLKAQTALRLAGVAAGTRSDMRSHGRQRVITFTLHGNRQDHD